MFARAPRILVFAVAIIVLFGNRAAAQDFRSVHDGVEYAEVTRDLNGKMVKVNLLRLDLKKVRIDVAHALDSAIGTEKTSSIATRHGAVAAINAGFFRLDKSIWAGDAAGVLKIDGELLSESVNGRIALGIARKNKRSTVVFGNVWSSVHLFYYPDKSMAIDGVNREPKPNEIILYTRGMATPLTTNQHIELALRNCGKSRSIASCSIATIGETSGGTVVPENAYVVYFGSDSDKKYEIDFLRGIATGKLKSPMGILRRLARTNKGIDPEFENAEDVVAGVPQLIRNGKIDVTWQLEKSSKSFVETRHPRTAVAKLKDGKFLMITVDGRTEQSGGIGLDDLAAYLLELGATDAMNLDGGGSTTMFLDGKVVNHPSDKEGERKVSDAIVVTLRQKARRAR
ncbi:MAG: phosphodiester glycosidase family protein [Acidobacteriota bacterium]